MMIVKSMGLLNRFYSTHDNLFKHAVQAQVGGSTRVCIVKLRVDVSFKYYFNISSLVLSLVASKSNLKCETCLKNIYFPNFFLCL